MKEAHCPTLDVVEVTACKGASLISVASGNRFNIQEMRLWLNFRKTFLAQSGLHHWKFFHRGWMSTCQGSFSCEILPLSIYSICEEFYSSRWGYPDYFVKLNWHLTLPRSPIEIYRPLQFWGRVGGSEACVSHSWPLSSYFQNETKQSLTIISKFICFKMYVFSLLQ